MIESIRTKLIENFNQVVRNRYLYETDLDKSELWNVYLSSFPQGANPIYKTRTVHDCSACRSFFKAIEHCTSPGLRFACEQLSGKL